MKKIYFLAFALIFGSLSLVLTQSVDAQECSTGTCVFEASCPSAIPNSTGQTCSEGSNSGICCTSDSSSGGNLPIGDDASTSPGGSTGDTSSTGTGTSTGSTSGSGSVDTIEPGWNPQNYTGFGLPESSIINIVRNVMMWLLSIFAIIGIIAFVISGILYFTAAGNEDQAERAKKAMMWSIIGAVVGMLGLIILMAATALLNANSVI